MRFGVPALFACGLLCGQFPQVRFEPYATGFRQPLDISHAGDGSGRLFVLEQEGRIRIIKNGTPLATPFLDIRSKVSCCGERGLLGIAFPPGYGSSKRHFYVHYSDLRGDTFIGRYRVTDNADAADPGSETAILQVAQPFSNHNGGQLAFGPDGFLYLGLGDGGSGGDPQNHGQNTNSLLGKILRLDVESGAGTYSIPPGNPFAQGGGRGEIWAYGLRNPWRFSFDRENGDLYIGDVGQNQYEEIDYQPASSRGGENYGWRIMEGRHCFIQAGCNPANFVAPVAEYDHRQGCSVTGGYVYRGNSYPALRGVYVYGDYCSGRVWGLRRDGQQWTERVLLTTPYNISAFGEDENGEMYLADLRSGGIFRVVSEPPPVTISRSASGASFADGGLVPGSIATLFGSVLTTVQGIAAATSFPLPRELRGTFLTINGIRAPLYAVANVNGAEQINFQVPFELPVTGEAVILVTNNGNTSQPYRASLEPMQPGVFRFNDNTGAILDQQGSVVTEANRAVRGRAISIYATGLGAVDQPQITGEAVRSDPLARTVTVPAVNIGGINAQVLFSGLAPGFAGLYQINALVPENAGTGALDLVVRMGQAESREVTLWVR